MRKFHSSFLCVVSVLALATRALADKENANLPAGSQAVIDELFVRNAALASARQQHLVDRISGEGWSYRVDTEKLTFGKKGSFHAQILGTRSNLDGTWLWVWANEASGLPQTLTRAAVAMRAAGEKNKWALFTTRKFPLAEEQLHTLAMAAGALVPNRGYYIGPGSGDAPTVLFLLDDPAIGDPAPIDLLRFNTEIMTTISSFPIVDHARAVKLYAEARGFAVVAKQESVTISDAKGCSLQANIDDKKRILKMQSVLKKECLREEQKD